MKTVFMGTPEFAAEILSKLIGRHEVVCAVTQPDKPKGRKQILTAPPVKDYAQKSGIEVLQPERIKDKAFVENFRVIAAEADVFIVAAYGQILPQAILSMPTFGCINVHASLLPKYRGAAPMQWAIINGESVTGVSIMKMDKGIDTGDIILQSEIIIEPSDTTGSLLKKTAVSGAAALIEALDRIENGTAAYTPQDDALSSYAPMITKETGRINFARTAKEISDLVRAMSPDYAAFTTYKGVELKILNAKTIDLNGAPQVGVPGEILALDKNGITVKTHDDNACILIREVQPQSGKRMDAAAFTRGRQICAGERFGE